MIFMDIVSWEPEDNARVGDIFSTYEYPEGMKVIDEWMDLSGCRSFIIYETDDPEAYIASIQPFMDICWFETFPVLRSGEYMQKFQAIAEKLGERRASVPEYEEVLEEENEEIMEQIEGLEKRVQRLEHHSFIQQEDTT
ncbi:hypothetical protein MSMTP_1136 [Methanosarcina sp. MTP4]|uniref:DUF3303 domain-containing protein n=1 Tax=Methanosarcina sp. MTP4 TaxID=1434100 RepID=UPI0006155493|nr:DUF3303 family protein [Methanosarcina sp. MTP4]AKB24605.1 hypothetical protein MSMTP_1136 [Methanosarcina sp. MTP4]